MDLALRCEEQLCWNIIIGVLGAVTPEVVGLADPRNNIQNLCPEERSSRNTAKILQGTLKLEGRTKGGEFYIVKFFILNPTLSICVIKGAKQLCKGSAAGCDPYVWARNNQQRWTSEKNQTAGQEETDGLQQTVHGQCLKSHLSLSLASVHVCVCVPQVHA